MLNKYGLIPLLLTAALAALPVFGAEELPDDAALQTRISGAFARAEAFKDALVQVASHRGFILLTGQVPSADLKTQATNTVVFASSDIRRIINELEVVTAVDRATAAADAALAGVTRDEIRKLDATLAEAVQVSVHRGVVYLMGAVDSSQAKVVAERVSFVPDVANVRTAFEIVPAP
jgi:osmotically-inducible protein OsmY